MNTSIPATKVGLIDLEINTLSKVLFVFLLLLSLLMTALKGFRGIWYIYYFRFLLLFSSIIPISMRVNLDLGKTVYSMGIMKDKVRHWFVMTNSYSSLLGNPRHCCKNKYYSWRIGPHRVFIEWQDRNFDTKWYIICFLSQCNSPAFRHGVQKTSFGNHVVHARHSSRHRYPSKHPL